MRKTLLWWLLFFTVAGGECESVSITQGSREGKETALYNGKSVKQWSQALQEGDPKARLQAAKVLRLVYKKDAIDELPALKRIL